MLVQRKIKENFNFIDFLRENLLKILKLHKRRTPSMYSTMSVSMCPRFVYYFFLFHYYYFLYRVPFLIYADHDGARWVAVWFLVGGLGSSVEMIQWRWRGWCCCMHRERPRRRWRTGGREINGIHCMREGLMAGGSV